MVHHPVNRHGGGHGIGEDALPRRGDQGCGTWGQGPADVVVGIVAPAFYPAVDSVETLLGLPTSPGCLVYGGLVPAARASSDAVYGSSPCGSGTLLRCYPRSGD